MPYVMVTHYSGHYISSYAVMVHKTMKVYTTCLPDSVSYSMVNHGITAASTHEELNCAQVALTLGAHAQRALL